MISPFPPRSFQGWRHFGSRTRSTENRHSNRIQGIYFSAKQQLRHPLALFSNLGTRPHFGVWKICGQEARGAGVRAARGKGRPLSRSIAARMPAIRQAQKVRRAHIRPKAPPGSLRRLRGSPRPGGSARRRAAGKTPVSRRGGEDLSAQLFDPDGRVFRLESVSGPLVR